MSKADGYDKSKISRHIEACAGGECSVCGSSWDYLGLKYYPDFIMANLKRNRSNQVAQSKQTRENSDREITAVLKYWKSVPWMKAKLGTYALCTSKNLSVGIDAKKEQRLESTIKMRLGFKKGGIASEYMKGELSESDIQRS